MIKKFLFLSLTTTMLIFCININANRSGKEIYDTYCTTCHSPQMASMFQAPAAHNENDWQIRKETASLKISKNSIKTDEEIINILALTATEGTEKGMPPKGTCMECTNEELKNAIIYMISTN